MISDRCDQSYTQPAGLSERSFSSLNPLSIQRIRLEIIIRSHNNIVLISTILCEILWFLKVLGNVFEEQLHLFDTVKTVIL